MRGLAAVRRHSFWLALGAGLAAVVIGTRAGSLAVDTKPEVYLHPWQAFLNSLSAWQTLPNLGQASFQVGLAPVAGTVAAIQALGVPPWLSMRLLRLMLLVVAAAGASAFVREASRSRADALEPKAAAFVYVVNPYLLVAGATLPVLWPYAMLPWSMLCIVRAMRTGRSLGCGIAFGFSVLLMTGQNAGAVPALQLVVAPVVLVWAAKEARTAARRVAAFLATALVSTMAFNAYWLLPSLAAVGAGGAIVDQSESAEAIATTSSFAEVIRGLGLWPLYGRTGDSPWVAAQVGVLTQPVVLAAGFLLPLLGWLWLRRRRSLPARLGVLLFAVAAVVMVGIHPSSHPAPAGVLWRGLLEAVPALQVLRTTNKAGAGLVLGLALLIGLGVAGGRLVASRVRFGCLVAVCLVATLPGWTGGLFVSEADVPSYWVEAGDALSGGTGRVWLLPGEDSAHYRWSDPRPDDLGQTVLDVDTLVRTTVGNTSLHGVNLLAQVDTLMQEGRLPPESLAVVARYLGVDRLLLRSDVVWEPAGGGDPATEWTQVKGAVGVRAEAEFGTSSRSTDGLAPLISYAVDQPLSTATLADPRRSVVIAGDGAAVPVLAQLGYLKGQPEFRYSSDLTAERLVELAEAGSRVVLTDTNRRAARVAARLTEDHGPVLEAGQPAPGTTALGDSDDQSVRSPHGWVATATREGSVFRPLPFASAENAVDDDPRTAWYAGDYGSAAGQVLTVAFGESLAPGTVVIHTTSKGQAQITGLTVVADDEQVVAKPGEDGTFTAALGRDSSSMRIRIESVTAGRPENVGISEVTVDGRSSAAPDAVRTPLRLGKLADSLTDADRLLLRRAPLDVVLSRVTGVASSADKEEENLVRDVDLPWGTDVQIRGLFSTGPKLDEVLLDQIGGDRSGNKVTSSSQAFDLPTLRASMALDGDGGTGWSPAEPTEGQSWQAVLNDPRDVSSVTLTQPTHGRQIQRVTLRVNGKKDVRAELRPGVNRIELGEPVELSSLKVTIDAASAPATESVRLLEVKIGDARVRHGGGAQGCFDAALLDGQPVRMRPTAPISGASFLAVECSATPRSLDVGLHTWRPVGNWVAETVAWADADEQPESVAPAAVSVATDSARVDPGWTAAIPASTAARTLVSGVGFDERWHLSVDGRDLGRPELVNGYTAGWTIPPGGSRTLALTYEPQSSVWWGLGISALSVALCVAVLYLVRRRPASRPIAWKQDPAGGTRPSQRPLGRPSSLVATIWTPFALAVAAYLALGFAGLIGAAVAIIVGRRSITGGWLLTLALWCAVPIAWFWGAGKLLGQVTPDLVNATGGAHLIAGLAVITSAVWVCVVPLEADE